MNVRHYAAEVLIANRCRLAESPFLDPRTGILSFVDITAGQLMRLFPDGQLRVFEAGQPLGAAVPAVQPGSYVFAAADGIYLFQNESMEKILDLSPYLHPWQRCNDAKADPAGRLFFGSVANDDHPERIGNLYRLDGTVEVLRENTRIANGMAWNRAEDRFFFSDSLEHAVFAYDYDRKTGDIRSPETLFRVTDGVPDGMCIDADDNLWLAVWGGRRIEHRSSHTGQLLSVIDIPAEHVTSCCFIRDHTLLITTAGDGLDGPQDGRIFTCRVDARAAGTHYCSVTGSF